MFQCMRPARLVTLLNCFLFLIFSNGVRAQLVTRFEDSRSRRAAPSLASASWIWAPGTNGTANTSAHTVAFTKQLVSPSALLATNATITFGAVAVGAATLWINDQPIGQLLPNTTEEFTVVRAALNASINVVSVLIQNAHYSTADQPGFVASIQVSYAGAGLSSTAVSDASWLATSNVQIGFPAAVNTNLLPAVITAPFLRDVSPVESSDPPWTGSSWLWATAGAEINADPGTSGFRKEFVSPDGKTPQLLRGLIASDNAFSFYVNGIFVAASPFNPSSVNQTSLALLQSWEYAQAVNSPLNSLTVVLDVVVDNYPQIGTTINAAGFAASFQLVYTDSTSDSLYTNASWSCGQNFSSDGDFVTTPTASMHSVAVLGPFGMGPWGQLFAVSDVLAAAAVPRITATPSASAAPATSKPRSYNRTVVIVCVVVSVSVAAAAVIALLYRRRSRTGPTVTPYSALADGADDDLQGVELTSSVVTPYRKTYAQSSIHSPLPPPYSSASGPAARSGKPASRPRTPP
ncbi:unnamed protein product [Mycena citricolor]|uniref:Uncharacterized protein n=1 Tax=Mycena citricolor TaxID=2018698 RepID=A0AAD2GTD9_9AGAR|nr:unnamed protein product [Mycena citricolor]